MTNNTKVQTIGKVINGKVTMITVINGRIIGTVRPAPKKVTVEKVTIKRVIVNVPRPPSPMERVRQYHNNRMGV